MTDHTNATPYRVRLKVTSWPREGRSPSGRCRGVALTWGRYQLSLALWVKP